MTVGGRIGDVLSGFIKSGYRRDFALDPGSAFGLRAECVRDDDSELLMFFKGKKQTKIYPQSSPISTLPGALVIRPHEM
jgi:hypothetical protein